MAINGCDLIHRPKMPDGISTMTGILRETASSDPPGDQLPGESRATSETGVSH